MLPSLQQGGWKVPVEHSSQLVPFWEWECSAEGGPPAVSSYCNGWLCKQYQRISQCTPRKVQTRNTTGMHSRNFPTNPRKLQNTVAERCTATLVAATANIGDSWTLYPDKPFQGWRHTPDQHWPHWPWCQKECLLASRFCIHDVTVPPIYPSFRTCVVTIDSWPSRCPDKNFAAVVYELIYVYDRLSRADGHTGNFLWFNSRFWFN